MGSFIPYTQEIYIILLQVQTTYTYVSDVWHMYSNSSSTVPKKEADERQRENRERRGRKKWEGMWRRKKCGRERKPEGGGTKRDPHGAVFLVYPSPSFIGGVFDSFDFSPVTENRLSVLKSHSHHLAPSTGRFLRWCTYQSIPCTESV